MQTLVSPVIFTVPVVGGSGGELEKAEPQESLFLILIVPVWETEPLIKLDLAIQPPHPHDELAMLFQSRRYQAENARQGNHERFGWGP